MQACTCCGVEKPLTDFEQRPYRGGAYRSQCRECESGLKRLRRSGVPANLAHKEIRASLRCGTTTRVESARELFFRKKAALLRWGEGGNSAVSCNGNYNTPAHVPAY
jgi:hypothetical protein